MVKYYSFLTAVFLCLIVAETIAQKEKQPQHYKQLTPLSEADSIALSNLPELTLPEYFKGPNAPDLPAVVDNSQHIFWRPVFSQVAYECGQASSIGLGFNYEINRLRNLPSDIPENQYTAHFTWNFANGGDGWYGVSYFHSLEIVRLLGNPSVSTYGGMSAGGSKRWMSGYDNYYQSMHNRISEAFKIDLSSEEGILTAKHWIDNHLESDDVGGVANFYTSAPYGMSTLPTGTPEAGMYVMTGWGGANHGLTVSGYHDSICWDYNNDGQYTNDIDINNDGKLDVRDWEIGGFRFANTYSGGPNWANNGFCYMTYKSCADAYGSGGIWDNAIHVMYAKENTEPLLTTKITLKHTCRQMIRVRMGISTNQSASNPDYILSFPVFNFQGGCNFMQGGTTEDDKTIEFGLDITPFLNMVDPGTPLRFFLLVDENDPNNSHDGEIVNYSIIDYTNGVNEIPCPQTNVPLNSNSLTKLSVDHTVSFNDVSIDMDTLPPASVYQPYSAQLTATGGTMPYLWDFERNFTETNYTELFPMITAENITPGNTNDGYITKALDFSFPFNGKTFDEVRVHVDGSITFEDLLTSWPYQVYEFLIFTKNKFICPFSADLRLYTGDGDGMWYEGDENSAMFRWKASVNGYQSSSDLNFAVELFPNGDIKFYYGDYNFYPAMEWYSGISAGNNKNYQFTEISGDPSIAPLMVCDMEASHYPEGFEISRSGLFSGTPENFYEDFEINFRVTDENNLVNSKTLVFSTDGSNYLMVDGWAVLSGGNSIIEFGETVQMSVSVKSLGDNPVTGASMNISTDDAFTTLIDSTEFLGDFDPGEVKTFQSAFVFEVDSLVPDEHMIDVTTLIADDQGEDWTGHIYLTAYAPDLYVGGVTLDDGGGNGSLDPGETVDLKVNILNGGGATANNIEAELTSTDPFVTIDNGVGSLPSISPNSSGEVTFTITADTLVPSGHSISFNVTITGDLGVSANGSFNVIAGQIPVAIIDLDPNTSSGPVMQTIIQDLGVGADYYLSMPTDINIYSSVFVCLGIYSDNHVLADSEGQKLADYLNNGGRLYMEGGDTWFYDSQTAVHTMFNIQPEDDGGSDMTNALGLTGTFTEGMDFYYAGENNWMDHISEISPAVLIFKNPSPEYGSAVAHDAGSYKTVGTSFEFGGLSDGTSPTTKEDLMIKYLEFFGIYSGDLLAGFAADTTMICDGATVNFADTSGGNIISWYWTFPGGDPASSTLQNPSVVYYTAGEYNVSLTVSDGTNTNTLVMDDFIKVMPHPAKPAMPEGDDFVCTSYMTTTPYTTTEAANSDYYIWELQPSDAGSITGTGLTGTVVWTPNWEGTAFISVKGYNDGCGEGQFSDTLEVICDLCTGISANEAVRDLMVFPNPASNEFYVRIPDLKDQYELSVFNLLNELIFSQSGRVEKQQKLTVNLDGQKPGIYFLRVTAGENEWYGKVILR